jgi:hypothetical protein
MEKYKNQSYITIYKMKNNQLIHSPTLESIRMVEKTAKKYSQEYGKYQLWKKLPKKMMYQTYSAILEYLEESGKIMVCKDRCIIYTFNPKLLQKMISEGVKFY